MQPYITVGIIPSQSWPLHFYPGFHLIDPASESASKRRNVADATNLNRCLRTNLPFVEHRRFPALGPDLNNGKGSMKCERLVYMDWGRRKSTYSWYQSLWMIGTGKGLSLHSSNNDPRVSTGHRRACGNMRPTKGDWRLDEWSFGLQ